MRAVILTSFGGLEALELADLPEPTPGEGEEVVSVRAVALGPWDLSAADGYFRQLGGSTAFPQVQGWDFAGQTADGRRVLGFTAQPWMGVGALAEQIAMPAVPLAPLPDGLDWAQGAALPVTALTARLLNEAAKVSEGDLVLVTGAAGMVGGMAAQLARARGARVVAAVRESDAARAHALGAEATVNTGDGLADELRQGWPDGFNACLDTIGLQSALAERARRRGVRDYPAGRGALGRAGHLGSGGPGPVRRSRARAARRTGRRRGPHGPGRRRRTAGGIPPRL